MLVYHVSSSLGYGDPKIWYISHPFVVSTLVVFPVAESEFVPLVGTQTNEVHH